MSRSKPPRVISYALEQLVLDQDRDWVIDTLGPVLAWVPGATSKERKQPFRFEVDHTHGGVAETVELNLSWDIARLETIHPGVNDLASRLRAGRSAQREHVPELAAYGLMEQLKP